MCGCMSSTVMSSQRKLGSHFSGHRNKKKGDSSFRWNDVVGGMLATLVPHPDTPCAAITSISAAVARTNDGQLVFRYIASGDIDAVVIPPPVRYSSRADELWKTTCFEAFIQADGDLSYAEFNFAPSTAWAAYRFASYRADMLPLTLPAPHFDVCLLYTSRCV